MKAWIKKNDRDDAFKSLYDLLVSFGYHYLKKDLCNFKNVFLSFFLQIDTFGKNVFVI